MDGENNGNPYFLMDDLGGFSPLFSENIHMTRVIRPLITGLPSWQQALGDTLRFP